MQLRKDKRTYILHQVGECERRTDNNRLTQQTTRNHCLQGSKIPFLRDGKSAFCILGVPLNEEREDTLPELDRTSPICGTQPGGPEYAEPWLARRDGTMVAYAGRSTEGRAGVCERLPFGHISLGLMFAVGFMYLNALPVCFFSHAQQATLFWFTLPQVSSLQNFLRSHRKYDSRSEYKMK